MGSRKEVHIIVYCEPVNYGDVVTLLIFCTQLFVGAISGRERVREREFFSEMRQNEVDLQTEQQGSVRAVFLGEAEIHNRSRR